MGVTRYQRTRSRRMGAQNNFPKEPARCIRSWTLTARIDGEQYVVAFARRAMRPNPEPVRVRLVAVDTPQMRTCQDAAAPRTSTARVAGPQHVVQADLNTSCREDWT